MLRFFNWFYFFVSIGVQDNVLVYVLAVTVLVYVQDNVGLDCRRHRRQGEGEAAPQQGMQAQSEALIERMNQQEKEALPIKGHF